MENKVSEIDGTVHAMSDRLDFFRAGVDLDSRKGYFKDPEAFATVLYRLCLSVFGSDFPGWESDTIVLNLHDYCPDISEINVDKILSLVALQSSMDGRFCFFNEINCFYHTVNVLNGFPSDYQVLGALTPHHIAWAVYEIGEFLPGQKLHEEAAKMAALSFHLNGYMIFNDSLYEYQSLLDEMNHNKEISPKVRSLWVKHRRTPIEELDEDDILELQLLKLRSIEDYISLKKQSYRRDQSNASLN